MSAENPRSPRLSRREGAALALLVGLLTLPFVGKPYHVDDAFFLEVTESILRTPLDPYSGQIDWWDRPQPLFQVDSNPPLLNYYLAPFAAVSGSSDLVLHLAMIPFTLLFAASVFALGRRFTGHPWWVLLFTLTSVAVLVSSNVMRDVPATALGVAAVAAFVRGADCESRRWLASGALLAGLAVLTKYSAAVLLPVLLLYPLLRGRPRLCGWVALSAAVFGLWCVHNQWQYGRLHILEQLGRAYSSPGGAWRDNLVGLPVVAGSAVYLLPAVLAASWASRDLAPLVAGGAAALVAAALVPGYTGGGADAQYLFWSITGSALLLVTLTGGLRGALPLLRDRGDREASDSLFLTLWLAGPLLFSVVFVPFQAVRHVLPALPPLVLIAFRQLEAGSLGLRRWRRVVLPLLLSTQVAVALLVASADWEYAASYRDFAARARAAVDARAGSAPPTGGRRIWFLGHWGWLRYAERAGLRKLHSTGPQPAPGDFLIVPRFVEKGWVLKRRPELARRLETVDEVVYPGRIPIRTMHPMGAGFYAVISKPRRRHMPSVPYRFGGAPPLEVFELQRVRAAQATSTDRAGARSR